VHVRVVDEEGKMQSKRFALGIYVDGEGHVGVELNALDQSDPETDNIS